MCFPIFEWFERAMQVTRGMGAVPKCFSSKSVRAWHADIMNANSLAGGCHHLCFQTSHLARGTSHLASNYSIISP